MNVANLAPVLIFCYKRLDTLKQTITALQKNSLAKDTELFIFSDGAKTEADKIIIDEIRNYLKTVNGFKCTNVKESAVNKGLANSIISGVTQVIEQYGRVIVLEDDLLTTPNFLTFMNEALNRYQQIEKIFSISGYSFNLGAYSKEGFDAYFLNRGWSWGWATWKDRWNKVDWEVSDYQSFKNDKYQQRQFSKGGSDLNKMLQHQMEGKLDSWAIRWFYHQFKVQGLTLYPVYSKIYNNGFDASATHTSGSDRRYRPLLDTTYSSKFSLPKTIEINQYFQERFTKKMGIFSRIRSKIETLLLNRYEG